MKKPSKNRKLTPLQQNFIREYLVDLNATAAAARAGYSAKTAKQAGSRLLCQENIQAALKGQMEKRARRTEVTADRVLQELAKVGFSEVTDYLEVETSRVLVGHTAEGKPITEARQVVLLKKTADIPPEKRAAISAVRQSRDGSIFFKLHDKKGALDSIARHLGMFIDRTEVTGAGGGPIQQDIDLSGLSLEELKKLAQLDDCTKESDS